MNKKKIRDIITYVIIFAVLGVGIYLAFFWGRGDYKIAKEDRENAQNILDNLPETGEAQTFDIALLAAQSIEDDENEEEVTDDEEGVFLTQEETATPSAEIRNTTGEEMTSEEIDTTAEEETKAEETTEEATTEEHGPLVAEIPEIPTDDNDRYRMAGETAPEETQFVPLTDRNDFEKKLQACGITIDTPEGTQGFLEYVLDFRAVGILRGVYAGYTWNDIAINRDQMYHFTVTAEEGTADDQTPGQTALVMTVHNSLRSNLAGNGLLNATVGMHFSIIAEGGIYEYQITSVYAMNRAASQKKIMRNIPNLPKEKAYIITCGRNTSLYQFRYKNMVIEGTMVKFTPFK